MSTVTNAEDFDLDLDHPLALYRIARFARSHSNVRRAHVTRAGHVLVVDHDGSIRTVRTMSALVSWLGY